MILILMGVSGCGKTTIGQLLAERLGWPFFDADDFHPPSNIAKMSAKQPLSDEDRRPWLDAIAARIRQCLAEQVDAIFACSALTSASRQILGVDERTVRLIYLKGDFELIRQRLETRTNHFMPPDLLTSQFQSLQAPPEALIVNIDASPPEIVSSIVQMLA